MNPLKVVVIDLNDAFDPYSDTIECEFYSEFINRTILVNAPMRRDKKDGGGTERKAPTVQELIDTYPIMVASAIGEEYEFRVGYLKRTTLYTINEKINAACIRMHSRKPDEIEYIGDWFDPKKQLEENYERAMSVIG